ncbi:hypothetical protein ABC565_03045 [Mycoplasmopsis synoviae]|uniref:Uncharacterized protein n=2 Tax=Mycoplasmopsis synoviae TaxID=2109 RepID=Q4A685_MYCS5|nr:hypothetical protein [Mycoplasmopsis synoviae]AAZ43736.2 hypothetical protein MS53_0323 [Mycoplasmopsis synoviae 53]MBD5788910.1 hypothetical protein [Mycoplasmopsis synoviae GX11-T]QGL45068.1 hypothetical protein EJ916_00840 [Mycoplasmopsis synoviae]QXV99707.1 hypothetical protein KXD88_01415 [Mycoplasmopsis synoviae]UBM43904.1 hypothetical protein LA081_01510 [Mycoplasmopsis synoviae]
MKLLNQTLNKIQKLFIDSKTELEIFLIQYHKKIISCSNIFLHLESLSKKEFSKKIIKGGLKLNDYKHNEIINYLTFNKVHNKISKEVFVEIIENFFQFLHWHTLELAANHKLEKFVNMFFENNIPSNFSKQSCIDNKLKYYYNFLERFQEVENYNYLLIKILKIVL